MLYKTDAVVIKTFPYKESSSIVSVYTRELGLKSYIIKGGRKKNASVKSSFFQPLQLLSIVVYGNRPSLNHIKECNVVYDLSLLKTNIIKTSLALFVDEILYLSLKEDNPNENLFDFVRQSVVLINDSEEKFLRDFHIYILYHLAVMLGFAPMNNFSETDCYFDINKGMFSSVINMQSLDKETSRIFHEYITSVDMSYNPFTENSMQRNQLLNTFILFFEEHITNGRQIKSRQILHTVL